MSTIDALLQQLEKPAADRCYLPGHERMHTLLRAVRLNRPALRIRIAGTNGKGSTAWFMASALQATGLQVGLFTSPHLQSFNERLRINLQPIQDQELRCVAGQLIERAMRIGASYFEMATAMALAWFSARKVDVEILEAGVGARLDATTAVPADMALITPIGLDHCDWLGDDLHQIAWEKAHVMKDCRIFLSINQDAGAARALRQYQPGLSFVNTEPWPDLICAGEHQWQNASLAWQALHVLAHKGIIPLRPDAWRSAMTSLNIPGRLQCHKLAECEIWLDAAHNLHAVESLLPWLKTRSWDAILVFTREDRNLDEAVPKLLPHCRRLIGPCKPWPTTAPNVQAALEQEFKRGTRHLLIMGSFTTVAKALDWLDRRQPG
ncbi:MAG: bifunctional folylpolyglutamate synthase/dihydrofolate synthase [Zetaproteobacteria bacterium]|nr:MAG: bifunctional folylpolyglutamate synthase/dihydrofolate synthase [Zetaproteobacteria bacterium]